MKSARPGLLLALALLASACGDETSGSVAEGEEAVGEVLGGTISDEMIPLEQLTSQPPPLPRATASAGDGGSGAERPAAAQGEASGSEPEDEETGAADTAAPPAEPAPPG